MRAVLDSLPDPVVLLEAVRDEDGVIVDFTCLDANAAALTATGATFEEFVGDRVLRCSPELGATGLVDTYARVVDTGDPATLNDQPYAHDVIRGHMQYLDIQAAKLGDGVTLTWRSRSELHATRQALDDEQARSRMTLDGLMDPVVLFAPVHDEGGHITDFVFAEVNQAACCYNQATREELQGSLLSVRYPDMWPLGMFDRYVDLIERGDRIDADSWPYTSSLTGVTRILDLRGSRVAGGAAVTWRDVTDRYLTEEALAESEVRFRVLAENATDVVLQMRADGVITWVSPSVVGVMGFLPEELVGTSVWRLIPEAALPDVRKRWERTGRGPGPVLKADGTMLWGSFRVTITQGPGGEATGAIIGMTDITDVVEANDAAAAARAGEARNQLSMDEAAIGILLADLEGTVIYANPALHEMAAVPAGAIVGERIEDGGPEDERLNVRELVRRVVAGESEHEHMRRRLTHLEGSTIWIDSFMSPLRNEAGVIDGLLSQVVDVTAEVANREALIHNAEHFRLLAENASDVVYETDRTGQIVWVSPSVLPALGWEPASLVGTVALDLVHPEDREWVARERAEVYEGMDKSGLLVRFTRSEGGIRYMSVSARVVRDGVGSVSGAVIGLHDVTTEVLMQNRIKRSEQMFRTAMVGAPQGMALSNAQDQITDVNPALEAILGAGKVAVLGLTLAEFVVPSDPPIPTCAERLVASGDDRIVQHEHELIRADTPRAWIEHSVSAIRDDYGTPMFYVHHVVDVTERRLREDDLGYRARHDVLTGLLNRDGLLTRLSDRLPMHGTTTLAVLYCDLDNLKPINDQHGHSAGDAVLVEVAHRIDVHLRRGDIVARIGGDEFVIVLDRIATDSDAMTVADKICQGARGPVPFDGIDLPASVSMGIAVADAGDTVESLLRRADQALYRAKTGGRARVST